MDPRARIGHYPIRQTLRLGKLITIIISTAGAKSILNLAKLKFGHKISQNVYTIQSCEVCEVCRILLFKPRSHERFFAAIFSNRRLEYVYRSDCSVCVCVYVFGMSTKWADVLKLHCLFNLTNMLC